MGELDDLEEINLRPTNAGTSAKRIRNYKRVLKASLIKIHSQPLWKRQLRRQRSEKARKSK